jgi:hypothetical protein
MGNLDIGTLYVLANRDMSLAKVGLTRNGTPDTRANDYSREHGTQWHVYWSAVTCNVTEAEARVHSELAEFRFSMVPGAREIFHITPAKAQRVAERYVVATEAQLAQEHAECKRREREAAAARVVQAEQDEEARRMLDDAKRLERQVAAYNEWKRERDAAKAESARQKLTNAWKRERDAAQGTDAVRYAETAVEKAERDAAKRKTDHTFEFVLAVIFLVIFILLITGS